MVENRRFENNIKYIVICLTKKTTNTCLVTILVAFRHHAAAAAKRMDAWEMVSGATLTLQRWRIRWDHGLSLESFESF